MMGPNVPRNAFDLSHERKLTCDMGKLIPVMCEEVLPGDHFKCRSSFLVRITPLLAPMMHKVDVFCHWFFVPLRLIWTNFEPFITGGADGLDATVAPYIDFAGATNAVESLADYLGVSPRLNTGVSPRVVIAYGATAINVSALPFRAYNLIYNEWYRDQTLTSLVAISKGDGADVTTATALQVRAWEKDYYTSALPWPQRGAAVTLPLGTTAPVLRSASAAAWEVYNAGAQTKPTSTGLQVSAISQVETVASGAASLDPMGGLYADLSTASAATINAIRLAVRVQRWLEKNARSGARYVENILAHFGVRSSDARLQRPEFLGGGRAPVVVSEVLQTSEAGSTPQGNMAGHGFSVQSPLAFEKSFEEHGFVMGIMSIMPRTGYYQGLPRMFSRTTKYDYYWPEFAHLGEQAVVSRELFLEGVAADSDTFGYQGRYDEYRRRESSVHGKFRTNLNFWHMMREFTARPTLVSSFVLADPTKRVNAVTTEPNCLVSVHHDVMAVRPIPIEGIPGNL